MHVHTWVRVRVWIDTGDLGVFFLSRREEQEEPTAACVGRRPSPSRSRGEKGRGARGASVCLYSPLLTLVFYREIRRTYTRLRVPASTLCALLSRVSCRLSGTPVGLLLTLLGAWEWRGMREKRSPDT